MPSDSLENPKTTGTTDGDDFTLIRGIAPKTAARLLEAGILTFEKLAGMTPGEIAARIGTNSGISAEGIAKKDWIRQAAELASKVAAARPSGDHPDGDQHSVSYVVQLTLDAQNRVRSSKVHHVQSGDERSWDHWNEVELVSFFTQRPELNFSKKESIPVSKEIAASSRPSPAAVPVQPSAPVSTPDVLRLDGVEVVPEATQAPSWILRQSQPFHARMNLELADATKLPFQEVDYTAVVKAKGLGSNQIHTLAEEQGTLKPEARVTLNVKGTAIPPGVYHLFASVTLNPPAQPSSPKHLLKAFSKGSLLEIY